MKGAGTVGLAVALLALALVVSQGSLVLRPKNVVIFAFDGLQAHHLALYGYSKNTTPNLDSFADSAYVFQKTVSPASWTVPSFMSIFTSRYPTEHGVTNKLREIETTTGIVATTTKLSETAPSVITLAEIFKRNGYVTAGFTGDAGVSSVYGFGRGFDTYFDTEKFGGLETSEPMATAWLRENRDKKFFLFVHGYDAHGQHVPKDGYSFLYTDPNYQGPYSGSTAEQARLREAGLRDGELDMPQYDVDFWRGLYDEKIHHADQAFGDFMKTLTDLGLLDSTIVVVLSDHGTEVYEHKRFDHGHSLYRELVDVLFAIRVPGHEGGRIPGLVSTLDLAPTILSLVGIHDPEISAMRGVDLSSYFGRKSEGHTVFSETDYRLYTHKRSITTPDGYVFILTRENGKEELYNLTVDPLELHNSAAEMPQLAYTLKQKLLTHLDAIGDRGPWRLGCLPVYADQCK